MSPDIMMVDWCGTIFCPVDKYVG